MRCESKGTEKSATVNRKLQNDISDIVLKNTKKKLYLLIDIYKRRKASGKAERRKHLPSDVQRHIYTHTGP